MELKVKLEDGAPLPRHAHKGDAGLDLTSRESVDVWPGQTVMVTTGVACQIPSGYVGLCFPRSGLALKHGISLANCVGVIDSGYRGVIHAPLHNIGDEVRHVDEGERVMQMVIVQYETVTCVEADELDSTERGERGFGSTGLTMVDLDAEVVSN